MKIAKIEEESPSSKKKRKKKAGDKVSLADSFAHTLDLSRSPDVQSIQREISPDLNLNSSIASVGAPGVNIHNYSIPTQQLGGPPSRVNKLMEKLKPRDFSANPKVLSLLNIQDYDRIADLKTLQLQVEVQIMEKLKDKWKTMDENKLVYLIKKQIVSEILKLEERKHVRQEENK